MATDKKRTLVDFLIRQAFDPVMHAKPDGRLRRGKCKA